MELQDTLVRCNWVVQKAFQMLRPTAAANKSEETASSSSSAATSNSTGPAFNAKKKFTAPKKAKLSRYSASARSVDNDNSESDSEGEYNDGNMVYDSDSEEDNEYEIDEDNLSDDKRRVLSFFNKGTSHELAAIQGCSKKKVENILELRPYTGWGDLVS